MFLEVNIVRQIQMWLKDTALDSSGQSLTNMDVFPPLNPDTKHNLLKPPNAKVSLNVCDTYVLVEDREGLFCFFLKGANLDSVSSQNNHGVYNMTED